YIAVKSGFPHDWRLEWYRGLIELVAGRAKLAHAAFDAVYDELPGEIAPKLARAVAAELIGDYFTAARGYEQVWRTDRSYVSAAFGLARVYLAQGAREGAIQALESIPQTSTHHTAAQVAAIKIKMRGGADGTGSLEERDLVDAAKRLERLSLDAERHARLSAEVLEAAHTLVQRRNGQPATASVLGCKLNDREVRFGLERCYRALARLAEGSEKRGALVEEAQRHGQRPMTCRAATGAAVRQRKSSVTGARPERLPPAPAGYGRRDAPATTDGRAETGARRPLQPGPRPPCTMWVAVRNGTAAVLPLGRPLPICGRRRPATSHRLVCRQPCSTGQPAAQAARFRVARWLQLRVDVPALALFLGHLLADLAPALDVAVLEEVLEPHGDEQGP